MNKTSISAKARKEVHERDGMQCVYCGNTYNIQLAHYIGRAQGGMGIPENLVSLCAQCHFDVDNGANTEKRNDIHDFMKKYLKSKYPKWDEKKLSYSRW